MIQSSKAMMLPDTSHGFLQAPSLGMKMFFHWTRTTTCSFWVEGGASVHRMAWSMKNLFFFLFQCLPRYEGFDPQLYYNDLSDPQLQTFTDQHTSLSPLLWKTPQEYYIYPPTGGFWKLLNTPKTTSETTGSWGVQVYIISIHTPNSPV